MTKDELASLLKGHDRIVTVRHAGFPDKGIPAKTIELCRDTFMPFIRMRNKGKFRWSKTRNINDIESEWFEALTLVTPK